MKANGHPDVLAALAAEVDGFEVALRRRAGPGPHRPGRARRRDARSSSAARPRPRRELEAAVEADATVNVESPLELRRLAVAAETAGVRVRTALRVNRDRACRCPAATG